MTQGIKRFIETGSHTFLIFTDHHYLPGKDALGCQTLLSNTKHRRLKQCQGQAESLSLTPPRAVHFADVQSRNSFDE